MEVTREMILEALAHCVKNDCGDFCPMKGKDWINLGLAACEAFAEGETVEMPVKLIEHVIKLLKAQEPKVMHVDEIQEFSTVWLEDVDKPGIIPAIYLETLCGRLGFIQPGRGMIYPKADECGKRWRPWTSRPTDAQKEAVKWE